MNARDINTLMRIDDQILGVSGDDILLPEMGERRLRAAINLAIKSQQADDYFIAFRLFWNDVRIRRQPWDQGIRSYVGWRLHPSLGTLVAHILATDITEDHTLALALGRDESGIWFPEIILRSLVCDLELSSSGDSPLFSLLDLPSLGPLAAIDTWTNLLSLISIDKPLRTVLIESPAYWSLVPGFFVPAADTHAFRLLAESYCCRNLSVLTRITHSECPIGSHSTMVPSRSTWLPPEEVVAATKSFDRLVDLDSLRDLAIAIPYQYRSYLLSSEYRLPLSVALNDFLIALIGRHLLTGIFTDPTYHAVSFLHRPAPPYEQAAVRYYDNNRLCISAGIIPAALTALGLIPEAPGGSIGGHRTQSYSWDTLCNLLGWRDLMTVVWPDRICFPEDGSHPFPGEWLILPPHLGEVLSETLQQREIALRAD